MSDKSQNKLIRIIGDQITTVIVEMIKNCIGWSLIGDSTPDVAHKEQLSICVRIVGRGGLVSEHILACKEATSVTANGLFLIIIKAFELKGVSFEKLVAQTYDGASNMSGCYNGLQAIIKEKIGNHILYVHCYAHSLNLVLKDTVSDDNNVVTLFEKLESLHNLVNRSMKVHNMFDDAQKDSGLEVLSVKRLNTVRWSSRELCLKVFFKRYAVLMTVLQNLVEDSSFDSKKRAVATGLRNSFLRKDIIATACLFKEIFTITGSLNKYLQSVQMDFGSANSLVSGALSQLQRLRDEPHRVTEQLKKFKGLQWDVDKQRPCRNRDEGENPEVLWRKNTFDSILDQILTSLRWRFEQNKDIFSAISLFSPKNFPSILDNFSTSGELADSISAFCRNYNVNEDECGRELLSFAGTFKKFKSCYQIRRADDGDVEEETFNDDEDDGTALASKGDGEKIEEFTSNSFNRALEILANPAYHLVDAYPVLYKVYGTILAIPFTSCTAERTFSVLNRVKSRLRSTMEQDRLDALLLIAIEQQIANQLNRDAIIDMFGRSSDELSRLLIK